MEVSLPRNTLLLLCGPAGSGKSTFAERHFLPTQVVSSDACRALVCDDPTDQSVSRDAFELLHFLVEKRLRLGRLTVVDATNLRPVDRRSLQRIGWRNGFQVALMLFEVPVETCLRRNAKRRRSIPEKAIRAQFELFKSTLSAVPRENYDFCFLLSEATQSQCALTIRRALARHSPPG